ncbi:hypothetical protein [Labilibacter marinus]|uniref:hypothetical protein n=1 Tax=Labilibacter marinus TaxID=1477105 RepID=UPI00117A02EE|nr:hypothetical protein [Labilibacter marinus]
MIYQIYHPEDNYFDVLLLHENNIDRIKVFINSLLHYPPSIRPIRMIVEIEKDALGISVDELNTVWSLSKSVAIAFGSVRVGIVVKEPILTAFACIYKSLVDDPNYQLNIFCTHEAASKWLIHK